MTDAALLRPYIPTAVHFKDSDVIEYVTRDCACIYDDVDGDLALVRDMHSREIIGFRLNRFSVLSEVPGSGRASPGVSGSEPPSIAAGLTTSKEAVTGTPGHNFHSDAEILAAARSDAQFDGREYDALPRHERERYFARSERALLAVVEAHQRNSKSE